MKKIIVTVFLIISVLQITACEKECPECKGTGQTEKKCYYALVELGYEISGIEYDHDEHCTRPGCPGYYYDECYTCKGKGKVED